MTRKLLVMGFLAMVLTQCTRDQKTSRETFVVASTTSTQDSGLLDALTPAFERANPLLRAKVVAVGSGEAMELGRRGDADVLLVHSPEDEEKFMQEGRGIYRTPVMSNDFVIAGPTSDPAEIRSSPNSIEAFRRIAGTQSIFLSRGDESGTHKRETDLWERAAIVPQSRWYLSSGQGMAETLMIAKEKRAYVLTDTATFRVVQGKAGITTLFSGDETLVNPYSVIPVAGSRKEKAAQVFSDWISGPQGQDFIRTFGKNRFGSPLFEPAGASTEARSR